MERASHLVLWWRAGGSLKLPQRGSLFCCQVVLIQKAARDFFRQNTWEKKHIHTPAFIKAKKTLKKRDVACFPFLRECTLHELDWKSGA